MPVAEPTEVPKRTKRAATTKPVSVVHVPVQAAEPKRRTAPKLAEKLAAAPEKRVKAKKPGPMPEPVPIEAPKPKRAKAAKTVEPEIPKVEPKPAPPVRTPRRPRAKLTDPLAADTITIVTVRAPKPPRKAKEPKASVPAVVAPAPAPKVETPKPKAQPKPQLTVVEPTRKRTAKQAQPHPPVEEPAPVPVVKRPRLTAAERKAATAVVYVARGGAPRGAADYEIPFSSRAQALAFLVNQHGLTFEEQKKLAKGSALRLNKRWHGSDACAIREVRMTPEDAERALKGDILLAA